MTTRAALITQSKQYPPGSRARKAVIIQHELRKKTLAELAAYRRVRRVAGRREWKQ